MNFVGIDPGKSGALAIIYDGGEVKTVPFEEQAYAHTLKELDPSNTFAVVEKVGAMPGQGVTSMFSFGKNAGFIEGLLTAYHIPYELVSPMKWKKAFSVTGDKNSSIAVAKRLFPDVDFRRTERCKKDHDGCAEALLMAEYAKRVVKK